PRTRPASLRPDACLALGPSSSNSLLMAFERLGRTHDELAVRVAAHEAAELARVDLELVRVADPSRRIAGAEETRAALDFLALRAGDVRLERVRVVVVEEGLRRVAVAEDVDEGPPGIREVRRPRGDAVERIGQALALRERGRVAPADLARGVVDEL